MQVITNRVGKTRSEKVSVTYWWTLSITIQPKLKRALFNWSLNTKHNQWLLLLSAGALWAGRCVWHSVYGRVWLLLADPWPFLVLRASPGTERWGDGEGGVAGRGICFSSGGLHVTRLWALMQQTSSFLEPSLKMYAHDGVVFYAKEIQFNYRLTRVL